MASRRTRIKGIANIPQRKRTNQENNDTSVDISNIGNILGDNESSNKILSSTLLANKPQENTEIVTDSPDVKTINLVNNLGQNEADVLEAQKNTKIVTDNTGSKNTNLVNNLGQNEVDVLEAQKNTKIVTDNTGSKNTTLVNNLGQNKADVLEAQKNTKIVTDNTGSKNTTLVNNLGQNEADVLEAQKNIKIVTDNTGSKNTNLVNNLGQNETNVLKPQENTEIVTDNPDSKNTNLDNNVDQNKTGNLKIKHDQISNSTKHQNTKVNDSQISKTYMARRKFLKPGINLNAVKKRENTNDILSAVQKTASEQNNFDQEISGDKNTAEENTSAQDNIKHEVANIEVINHVKPTDKVVVLSEIRIPKQEIKSTPVSRDLTNNISNESYYGCADQKSELTLNETYLGINEMPIARSSVVTFAPNIKRIIPETHMSDTEYPAPPPSPSKINRSRIKAIPRLHQRKTSCSASESEDETRKYGRIRNNSVCSVVSTTYLELPAPTSETQQPPKEFAPVLQKKINRSEQSRKLAEARREFHKRFGSNNPDKQRLKMIDLIFYNPTSNPMSQKNIKTKIEDKGNKVKEDNEEAVDPLNVDVVDEKPDGRVNNADTSMPVPQIKIGPSGEIILDDQSLIVENAEIAKQKEQLLNSQLVDGDFDIGYGIYKKVPRALAWTQKETLRFYKALNLIGTDFTVMTQLFKKRSRRELKIKFKKEEKINKHLIDKAIMQPCSYNFTDLKREIQIEEEEEAALEKLRQEETKALREKFEQKKRKAKEARTVKSALKIVSNDEAKDKEDTLVLPPKKRIKSLEKPFKIQLKPRKIKAKPLNINTVLDDSDADISDMETQSESEEEETIPFLKPTRSGRMPKSTMRFTTIIEEPIPRRLLKHRETYPIAEDPLALPSNMTKLFPTADDATRSSNTTLRQRRSSSLSSIESNSEKLVPGSVIIMTEEDSENQLQYKVFMVTPERKMTPLELDSETIAKLVKEKQKERDFDFLEPPIPEKNITIPAIGENEELESDQKCSE